MHLGFRYVAFWIYCVYLSGDLWLVAMYTVLYVGQCVTLFVFATVELS